MNAGSDFQGAAWEVANSQNPLGILKWEPSGKELANTLPKAPAMQVNYPTPASGMKAVPSMSPPAAPRVPPAAGSVVVNAAPRVSRWTSAGAKAVPFLSKVGLPIVAALGSGASGALNQYEADAGKDLGASGHVRAIVRGSTNAAGSFAGGALGAGLCTATGAGVLLAGGCAVAGGYVGGKVVDFVLDTEMNSPQASGNIYRDVPMRVGIAVAKWWTDD